MPSWTELAAISGIEPNQLAKLALCQRPRAEFFTQDVAQIAGYSGINRIVLLHFIACAEKGVSMQKASGVPPKPVRDSVRREKGKYRYVK